MRRSGFNPSSRRVGRPVSGTFYCFSPLLVQQVVGHLPQKLSSGIFVGLALCLLSQLCSLQSQARFGVQGVKLNEIVIEWLDEPG